jgi:hypothetical protein
LFAYDALGAARTAVFFAGVPMSPAQPPVQLHVVSSRVTAAVGELLLHPKPPTTTLPLLVAELLVPELEPPPLPEPEPLLAPLPLLPPPLPPLEPPEPPEPLEVAVLLPPSGNPELPEEQARKAKKHPAPAARNMCFRLIGPRPLVLGHASGRSLCR